MILARRTALLVVIFVLMAAVGVMKALVVQVRPHRSLRECTGVAAAVD